MMAYVFPLTIPEFLGLLPISAMTFDLPESVEISETGSGEILTADLGTRLWQGEVTLADMTADEAAEAMAMIDVARRSGGCFMIHDVSRPYPRADLTGAGLGSAAPTLLSVAANSREIRLQGLPPNYQLRRYDYVAFSYGSNPVRHALHRIVAAESANSVGTTGLFEVVPNIRPGAIAGVAVTLARAACKAIIVPKSVQPGRRKATMTTGASFRWIQTLR